jgi:ParB-like chromosome segregation protein Spo0J
MVAKYKIEPEIQKCLPPLDKEAYQDLKTSLEKGYDKDYPIIVWKGHGVIVDGHHRYSLCRDLGKEPVISEKDFESIEDAIIYALDHQKSRRNLAPGQLAIIGIARYEAGEKIAARKRQAVENREAQSLSLNHSEVKGKSATIIANKIGITTYDVESMRAVKAKGLPEIETLVMKEGLSPAHAAIFARHTSPEKQKEIIKDGGINAVREHARQIKRDQNAKQIALKVTEKERKFQEDQIKERQEINEYKSVLKEQFGDSKYACRLSSWHELWCNDCKCGFDVCKPYNGNFCPDCGRKNIVIRNGSWYPGKKVI